MARRSTLQSVEPSGYAGWLVAALQDPAVYGETEAVELRETSVSWVFLAGERAYKLKKPVRLWFVDYSTPARRRAMCHDEVRLNRRLAREIYLGVCAIVRDGPRARLVHSGHARAIDHVVEMRRYDESVTAAAALLRGEAIPVDAIARRLVAFHAAVPARRPPSAVAACRARLAANVSALRALLPARALVLAHQARLAETFIDRHGRELERRARLGCVRDGHGDLRAEHVLLTRPPAIVDCIEFDAARRTIDVGADLACLKVDLAARGEPATGDELVEAYRRAGGDPGDDRLLDFWCAQQSHVEARIVLSRHGHAAIDRADALLDVASHFIASAARADAPPPGPGRFPTADRVIAAAD
jgi:aminoglycoside phosphotransferase family enzyme